MPLSQDGLRVIMQQLKEVKTNPVDCIALLPSEDLSELRFELDGPEGTPFAEGRFLVVLRFGIDYPQAPPKGYFLTKIFHPNVAPETGDICVDALKQGWEPSLGLRHILVVIRCLLVEPNPESALNPKAGGLLVHNCHEEYEKQARMMTSVYAKRPVGVPRHRSSAVDELKEAPLRKSEVGGRGYEGEMDIKPSIPPGLRQMHSNVESVNSAEKAKKIASDRRKNALRRL